MRRRTVLGFVENLYGPTKPQGVEFVVKVGVEFVEPYLAMHDGKMQVMGII